jgi:hypothetical protein
VILRSSAILIGEGEGGIVIPLLIGRISLRNIGRDIAMLRDLLLLLRMIREKLRSYLIALIKMGDRWIGMGMFGNRVEVGVGGERAVFGVRMGG